ncbi:site-specific DNA-methyltransferase [bacterium]|nr:site-specific DNA-methyltransferase [bacterium]NBT60225.1 site-specific DNA-methyltransferase [Planctomycetia bacterium]
MRTMIESLADVHNYRERWTKPPRNAIYQGSAEALLWRLPRSSVDIFWFSPPYNLEDRFRGGDSGKTGIKTQYDNPLAYHGDGTGLPEPVYQSQQQLVLTLCAEAMKSGGVMFYSHKVRLKGGRSISPREWIDRTGLIVIQEIIWDRGSTAQGDPRRLHPVYETIYILAKKLAIKTKDDSPFLLNNPGKQSGGPGYSDVWSLSPKTYGVSRRESGHPAVTPAEIVRRCLQISPFAKGALVCDPYCGTGTTGKVAMESGFDYLLADISMRWAESTKLSLQTSPLDTEEPVFCGEGDA